MAPRRKPTAKTPERERYGSIEGRSQWLSDVLRRRVWSYLPGSRLPGERELAKQFRVSLRVARRATEILAGEGLVHCRRGKGSVVVHEQLQAMPVRRIIAIISGGRQGSAAETQAMLLGAHEDCTRRGRPFEVVRGDRLDLSQPDCLMSIVRGAGLPAEIGWMFVRLAPPPQVLDIWQTWRLAVVVVDDDPRLPGNAVNSDGQRAVGLAFERAFLLGHRHIAYLGNTAGAAGESAGAPAARWQGFGAACQRFGQRIDEKFVWRLESSDMAEPQPYLAERLSGELRPTAIITADQRIGCDGLAVCERLGIAVPGQISVISAGLERRDLPRELVSRLSRSSEGRPEKIGQLATGLLLEAHQALGPAKLLADCEWIDGDSLGPPPAGHPGGPRTLQ